MKPISLDSLWRSNIARAVERVHAPVFKRPRLAKGFLPVVMKGGIGDMVVSMPLIDQLLLRVDKIKVHCNYPDVFTFLRPGLAHMLCLDPFPGYDHWLYVETAPRFQFSKNFKSLPKALGATYLMSRIFESTHKREVCYQPLFDGELWQSAAKEGLKRHTIGCAVLGFKNSLPKFEKWNQVIDLEPFITVHDGFDQTQDPSYRATKTWNFRHWEILIPELKRRLSDYRIVQLGGKKSRPIPGVHFNYSGIYDIANSFRILSRSSLHIDGDSGLVHMAHAYGVPSVVLFGPTPSNFFGYEDNDNINPKECGGCCWKTESWMNECPLYDRPKCLDSILPMIVLDAVLARFKGKV